MNKQERTAVVCWTSNITGHSGHGSPVPRKVAIEVVKACNEQYKGIIEHWVVPAN